MKKTTYKGLPAQIMENEYLKLTFLPTYAFKLASLISKKTDREFLFQSDENLLRVPSYGADFSAYDSSGFDEVFPSIDACLYPEGKYQGTPIPDHGEVWAMQWHHILAPDGKSAKATIKSEKLPYIFSKNITLKDNQIAFEYTVENTDNEDFKFIWTPHCLLACSTDTKLLIPPDLNRIISVEHSSQHLGPWGTQHNYPLTQDIHGQIIDLSKTEPESAQNCEKFYFTSSNTSGWCGIEHTDTGEQLIYQYDALRVPYLGVWKTQGGYRGDYNIALEPCTGIYDDLYVANKIRRVSVVTAGEKYTWTFTMIVQ